MTVRTFVVAIAALLMSAHVALAAGHVRPDPVVTPGATNPAVTEDNILQTICVRGWTRTVRPPEEYTYQLKRHQLYAWGYRDPSTHDYEEDHLIPLELGGSPTSPKNLWPEPWRGQWNAHTKDRLENYLHKQVCSGRMPLEEAQQEIATDWIAAFQKYLGSSH